MNRGNDAFRSGGRAPRIERAVPRLTKRAADAHKGDLGRVLVAAGSVRMPGAAYLVGQGAMRAGAGLVTIACPERAWPAVAAKVVTQTLAPVSGGRDGCFSAAGARAVVAMAPDFDALVVGPGLGAAAHAAAMMILLKADRPLVADADGLNALAAAKPAEQRYFSQRAAPSILTPHPGEAARLLGATTAQVQARRTDAALALARRFHAVVVLKGAASVVTDGRRLAVNATGNPGMATGGSGDVLAGVCGAFLARGLAPFDAARLATHVHGRAGDLARARVGEEGLLATDLLDSLPRAISECVEGVRRSSRRSR